MQYYQSVIVAWTLDSFVGNVYDILELQEMKLIMFFSLYILLLEEHDCRLVVANFLVKIVYSYTNTNNITLG